VCIADSLSLTNLGTFLRNKTTGAGNINFNFGPLFIGLHWCSLLQLKSLEQ